MAVWLRKGGEGTGQGQTPRNKPERVGELGSSWSSHSPHEPVRVLSVFVHAFQLLQLDRRELTAFHSWLGVLALRCSGSHHEGLLGQLLPSVLVTTAVLVALVTLVGPVGFLVHVMDEAQLTFISMAFLVCFWPLTLHRRRSSVHFLDNFALAAQAHVTIVDVGGGSMAGMQPRSSSPWNCVRGVGRGGTQLPAEAEADSLFGA